MDPVQWAADNWEVQYDSYLCSGNMEREVGWDATPLNPAHDLVAMQTRWMISGSDPNEADYHAT